MRNYRYGAVVAILAGAFAMLGPVTAQASAIHGTMPAASHHLAIGSGQGHLGLPAQQRTHQRANQWCDRDDWWGNGYWNGNRCGFNRFNHRGDFDRDGFFGHRGNFNRDGFFGHRGNFGHRR